MIHRATHGDAAWTLPVSLPAVKLDSESESGRVGPGLTGTGDSHWSGPYSESHSPGANLSLKVQVDVGY
jgi:hypothetical protein